MKSYVRLIAEKRYEEALHLILENNPFPGICGRICTHPCEVACSPGLDPNPIPIKELKRYAADYELSRRGISVKRNPIRYPEKIAVVGAGSAGLTTAVDLSKHGYDVTVFERGADPGGMLVQCIPRYRLPKEIVDFEIEHIKRMGVSIITSHEINNLDSLLESGYSVVILALGAQRDRRLNIPGSDLQGVLECLPLLRKINSGNQVTLNGRGVVIGGGSSAFDAARTACRIGAEKVTIVYRRSENEMPANIEEIEQAKEEGIEIITLALPEEIKGKECVESVRLLKTELGEADSSGRRTFLPIKDSGFNIAADWVIPAVGYAPDVENLTDGLTVTKWGAIKVDKFGRTTKDNVFATGDVVTGPSTVIDAVGMGHSMADIVHSSFRGSEIDNDLPPEMATVRCEVDTKENGISVECVHPGERIENFNEVVLGLGELDSVKQAQRCRSCGSCHECSVCLSSCDQGQLYATTGEISFLLKAPYLLRDGVIKGETDWEIENSICNIPIKLESLVPVVDEGKCIACGRCEEVCPYSAVHVRLVKEGAPVAVVDPDVCRTCGLCITSCISEALDQGPLSIKSLRCKINSISEGNTVQPLIFTSLWSARAKVFNPELLLLMNINAIPSALMIEGLATGATGILIVAPPEDDGSHYLQSERSIEENVRQATDLLSSVGIDPMRIRLERGSWRKHNELLNNFKEELSNNGFGPINNIPSSTPDSDSQVLRTMAHIEWLSKYPDDGGSNLIITDITSIAYMRRLNIVLKSEGFLVLNEMVSVIESTLKEFDMEPDKSTFSDLARRFSITSPIGVNSRHIALLRCPGDEKYGINSFRKLLSQVQGDSVTEIHAKSSGMEWFRFNRDYLGQVREILHECKERGIEKLITVTPFSTAALKILTRRGAWQGQPISLKDVFTFLSEITGHGAGGCK